MRKLVTSIFMFFTCGSLQALPVGNPYEASLFTQGFWWDCACYAYDPCFSWCDSWSVRLGFAGDYNFNRHMKLKHEGIGENIDITQINTNSGYLVVNFCDRVDFFGKLGVSKIHIRTNAISWGSTTSLESELNFETFLSWSAGGRATLWEGWGFAVGVESEYFQTVPEVDSFLNYNDGTLTYFPDSANAFYSEWQIGLGTAYRFATCNPTFAFVPYAAVKWASAKLNMDDYRFDDLILHNLKSKKPWGYAVGLTFTMCNVVGVTVEGRWASEKAIYVNAEGRF